MVTALAVLLLLFSAFYRYSGTEREIWIADETEQFHPVPDGIEVAVFGSSHGKWDIRSGPEGYTFFNFSLGSQTPYYDLAMMRQYEKHIKENALVILTISYMSPYWHEPEDYFQQKQGRYYRLLDPENIIDVDMKQYALLKIFPVLGVEPHILLNRLLFPVKTHPEPMLDSNNPRQLETYIKGETLAHWENIIKPVFPQPVSRETYEEIFALCEKHNWRAVLVTPPYTKYYNDIFPPEFYPTFLNDVNSMAEEHNALYFDYSHEEDFAVNAQWYRDIDHLNADGAQVFIARFYTDMETAGLL